MQHSTETQCEISMGLDLGDRYSYLVALRRGGEVVEDRRVATTRTAMQKHFGKVDPGRIVLEAGGQSAWVSALLEELGHDVVVANPSSSGALLRANGRKNDKIDATMLAGLGFDSAFLLRPIQHRSRDSQADLMVLKARDSLVRARTDLINAVRAHAKCYGFRLPSCSAESFHKRAREDLSSELKTALLRLIDQVGVITENIKSYDKQISKLLKKYPETEGFRQVTGVGPITAVAFHLTIDDPHRFSKSRKVGAFVGLAPGQHDSGDSTPQLRITKAGNAYLRRLLVSAAHYILGHFGPECDLRRFGERLSASGGKRGKKRAVVAVARKLAVLLHKLWVSGADYDPDYSQRTV